MVARYSANKNGGSYAYRCYANDLNVNGQAKSCVGDNGELTNNINGEPCYTPNYALGQFCSRNWAISQMIQSLLEDCPSTTEAPTTTEEPTTEPVTTEPASTEPPTTTTTIGTTTTTTAEPTCDGFGCDSGEDIQSAIFFK